MNDTEQLFEPYNLKYRSPVFTILKFSKKLAKIHKPAKRCRARLYCNTCKGYHHLMWGEMRNGILRHGANSLDEIVAAYSWKYCQCPPLPEELEESDQIDLKVKDASEEVIIISEVNGYPGFYHPDAEYFPNSAIIGISKCGKVLDLVTKEIHDPLGTNTKPRNFVYVHINNKTMEWFSIPRLLAMTFIEKPSKYQDKYFTELNVDHLDYNIYNNSLDNLEWTDDCGLPKNWYDYNETLFSIHDLRANKDIVSITDSLLYNVPAYKVLELIKFLTRRDLDILMLHRYMITHPEGIRVGDLLIHFSDDNIDWDKITFEHTTKIIPNYINDTVKAVNILTGEEKIFDTIKEAACFFDINPDKLKHHLITTQNYKHRYGLWVLSEYGGNKMPYHDLNHGSIYPPVDSVSVCYHDKINDEHYIFLHIYDLINKYKNINVDEAIYYLRQDRRYETKYGTITFLEDNC